MPTVLEERGALGEAQVEGEAAPVSASSRKQALLQRQRELEAELSRARHAVRRARSDKENVLAEEPEEEGWLLTYLDLMTLLLVLLVVMLAFAGKGSGLAEEISKRSSDGVLPASTGLMENSGPQLPTPALKPKSDPLAGLALEQLGDDIDVVVTEGTVSFRISSEILFSSGQAELSLDGLRVLHKLVPVLNGSPTHRVAVEGHTDSVPIRRGRFPSNWELSGARAGSVVRYLEANGVASARLRAVGYADTRPLADNATNEGRASNRRVELTLEAPQ